MWNNLSFTQLETIFAQYQKSLSWWSWAWGEHNIPALQRLRDFIGNGLKRAEKQLTDDDKIELIKVIATISNQSNWRVPNIGDLSHALWQNECSWAMRAVLCAIATSPQFNMAVLNALQTNSIANSLMPTQSVAPSDRALQFVKEVADKYLISQNALTPLYLRWCIIIGETTSDPDNLWPVELAEKLLKVPAPYPFLMDGICMSEDVARATEWYIANAKALQRLSAKELTQLQKEHNPLGMALVLVTLRAYPAINTLDIGNLLNGVAITPHLVSALGYVAQHGVKNIRGVIESFHHPLALAKDLHLLQMLQVSAECEAKLITIRKRMQQPIKECLFDLPGLTKESCELIINAELDSNLVAALYLLPPDLLTPERCKKLSFKNASFFEKFHQALIPFKRSTELSEILDLIIESSCPQKMAEGSTALIQAKLLNPTGFKLLRVADRAQTITEVSSALRGLETAKLLSSNVVDALFKEISEEPVRIVDQQSSVRASM